MTSIKNYKPPTVLIAIVALVGTLALSTVAIGTVRTAFAADTNTKNITNPVNNTGVNLSTDTNQKQSCVTAGSMSPLSNSCTASSTDTVTEGGGILKR